MTVSTRSLRNVAFAGHGGTGKTTLVEEMLAAGGAIPKAERVESGKTVSDFTEEEIARKISVHTSLSHITWKDCKINLLDTPGSADFVGEVVAAFRVAECAALVVGADVGVQIETIKLWRRLAKLEKPRFVFVNKMEKERADFARSVADLVGEVQGELRSRRDTPRRRGRLHGRRGSHRPEGVHRRQGSPRPRGREGRGGGGAAEAHRERGRGRRLAHREVLQRGHPHRRRRSARALPAA